MDYMERAISLAKLALGHVSPNPAVGAVIVKNRKIVGEGYTQQPGSAHAEVVALNQAGGNSGGATMYVTLEPCCHYGRTPPCTKAIIEAGIKEVHIAMLDPNPVVAGKGQKELEAAGINVLAGEKENEARCINEAYIKYITTGMPFVTAKFAMSLDGKIATRTGDSKWISTPESRRHVHYLRYISDAVMVGANTVLSDDPQLTSRCSITGGTARNQPLRVIIDGKGRISAEARLFKEPGAVLLAIGNNVNPEKERQFIEAGARLEKITTEDDKVDLKGLLKKLAEMEITSILVEGGGTLLGALFDEELVDKVIVFIAPFIIGGDDARVAVGGKGVDKVVNSIKIENLSIEQYDQDLMFSGYVGG